MSAGVAERPATEAARHGVRPLSRSRGWAPALRVARRDLRSHLGRTALAVVMLALPLGLAGGVAVLQATTRTTVEEGLPGQVGASAGLVTDHVVDGAVQQDVSGERLYLEDAPVTSRAPLAQADVEALLPGTRLLGVGTAGLQLVREGGDAGELDDQVTVTGTELDTTDPLTAGTYVVVDGRLPGAAAEVALSPGAARRAGVAVGDRLTLYAAGDDSALVPLPALEVVGLAVRQGGSPAQPTAVALPGQLGADPAEQTPTWLVGSDRPLGGDDVAALNAAGLTLLSPDVLADPPPGLATATGGSGSPATGVYVVAVVLVVLQVVLLAAPAFAVSVRQQRTDFALLGATGADSRALRRVVLASAGLVGAVAAALGLLLGVGGTVLVLVLGYRWLPVARGPLELPPATLAVVLVLGLGAALMAAWFPARSVARADVVAGLAGRRGVTRTPWRLAGVGLAVLLLGQAALWVGAAEQGQQLLLAVGVLLCVVGVLLAVPLLVAALEPVARRLPLPLRLAARDTSRSAGRSVAAVAAVAAVSGGVMAMGTYGLSEVEFDRATYQPQLRDGLTVVGYDDPSGTPGTAALEAVLPPGAQLGARSLLGRAVDDTTRTYAFVPTPGCEAPPEPLAPEDAACALGQRLVQGTVVAEEATLEALGLELDAEERDVLRGGGVLLFPEVADLAVDGVLTAVPVLETVEDAPPYDSTTTLSDPVRLPALAYDGDRPPGASPGGVVAAVVLPATAEVLAGSQRADHVVLAPRPLTTDEERRVDDLDGVWSVHTERGYQPDWFGQGLVVVGVAVAAVVALAVGTLTAAGLALVDARPTYAVLSDVGARGRTRRLVAGATAAVVAAVGGLAGVVMGSGPGVALARLGTGSYYDLDQVSVSEDGYLGGTLVEVDPTVVLAWPVVLALLVVIPLVLGGVVAAVARGHGPRLR